MLYFIDRATDSGRKAIILLLLMFHGLAAADVLIPSPPKLDLRAYLLMDAATGKILVEHNADERLPQASLTKMMTSYVAAREIHEGNIGLKDRVRISEKAWKMGGSRMFLRVGTEASVDELLHGIIIQSGNDASVAMAEHVAGSEDTFVEVMNHQAQRMGLVNTQYRNAHGWPAEGHYSSARDLALLARAIVYDFPEHYDIYRIKEYTYNGIRQPNRNSLLWEDDSVDGLKTGHTEEAGYCLVASAQREGMRLITVVMGADSESARARESRKLLTYGFRYYESVQPYAAGDVLNEPRVWGGMNNSVPVGLAEAIRVTIPRGQGEALAASLELEPVIHAPVRSGTPYGTLKLRLGDELLAEQAVVAMAAVEQGGLFKRLFDWVRLFVARLLGQVPG